MKKERIIEELLNNNFNLNEHDIESIFMVVEDMIEDEDELLIGFDTGDIDFYQSIIDAMEENGIELLTRKKLKSLIEEGDIDY